MIDDELLESADNKAKKGVKRQKFNNDKVSTASNNDINPFLILACKDEINIKDTNTDLTS